MPLKNLIERAQLKQYFPYEIFLFDSKSNIFKNFDYFTYFTDF